MTILSCSALLVLVLFTLLIPGYLVYACMCSGRSGSRLETLAYSYALGVPIIASIHFLSFLTGLSLVGMNMLGWFGVVAVAGAVLIQKKIPLPGISVADLKLHLLFAFYCLGLVIILPQYNVAEIFDWTLYFPNVDLYLHERSIEAYDSALTIEYLFRRTPFYSLICSFYLSFTGSTFPLYQVISVALNSLLFWAVYLVAVDYFNKKTVILTLVMLPLIPILTFNMGVPTPRPALTFLILMSWVAYLEYRKNIAEGGWKQASLLGVFIVTSGMYHPSALFYLIWIFGDQFYLILTKKQRLPWKLLIACLVSAGILILPWMSWGVFVRGIEAVLTPTYSISEEKMSLGRYLSSRFSILATTIFMPVTQSLGQVLFKGEALQTFMNHSAHWGNFFLRANMQTIFGGMTYLGSLTMLACWFFYGKIKSSVASGILLRFLFLGAGLCLWIHILVDDKGLAFVILAPLVTVLFIYFCSRVALGPVWVQVGLVMLTGMEFLYHRYLCYQTGMINKRLLADDGRPFTFLFDLMASASHYPLYVVMVSIFALAYFKAVWWRCTQV